VRFEQGAMALYTANDLWPNFPWQRWTHEKKRAEQLLSSDPPPDGFISEFVSPVSGRHTAVAIHVSQEAELPAMEKVFGGVQSLARVYGNISFLQGGQFYSFSLKSKSFSMGTLPWDEHLHLWLQQHYYMLPVFLMLIAAVLAIRMNKWLDERAQLRLQGEL
jgi:hypothetical protein